MRTTRLRLSLWSWKKQVPPGLAERMLLGACVLRTSSYSIWVLPCTMMGLVCVLVNQSAVWLYLLVLFVAGVQQKHRGGLGGDTSGPQLQGFSHLLCVHIPWEVL